jgi:hypothetical protein
MSDNDNRDLFEHEAKPKNALLDELDSLKELLAGDEPAVITDEAGACDPDIPMLDDVVDIDSLEMDAAPGAIPVLQEVAFPEEVPAHQKEPSPDKSDAESSQPDEQELSKLIDMLVGHRLRRLRPKIKEEVLEELRRLYPDVFH